MRRQMPEVCNRDERIAEIAGQGRYFLVRTLEKRFEHAELFKHRERRRMDRVAAKVAQEIGVLLQQDGSNPSAGKEQRRHHSGRSAPDDAATGLRIGHRRFFA